MSKIYHKLFEAEGWMYAYLESQHLLTEVIAYLMDDLQKAEAEYLTALQQHQTRRAQWLYKQIPLLKTRIAHLQSSLSAGEAFIESMAGSLWLEYNDRNQLYQLTRTEARVLRVSVNFWQHLATKFENQLKNLNHNHTHAT